MKTSLVSIVSVTVLCTYGLFIAGCNSNSQTSSTTTTTTTATDDGDHDDHDHDHDDHDHDDHDHADHDHADHDHEGHDHPEHGPNGGHMVNLSGGAHAEWTHEDEKELITVYAENPDTVTKVEMKTNIEGSETVYAFEKKEVEGTTVFQIVSPELLTAVKMGKAVDTKLVITTADGEATAQVEHHAH